MDRIYFTAPTCCPVCGTAVRVNGKYLECPNPSCPAVMAGAVRKWIVGIGVDYFGEAMINDLVKWGHIKSIADLYTVDRSAVASLCGSGMAKRAFDNLDAKRLVPIHVFFGSLNISTFGDSLAAMLVKAGYDTVDKMLAASASEFERVSGFGADRAKAVYSGLQANKDLIRALEKHITVQGPRAAVQGGHLSGKSVCITGSLSKPKSYFRQLIEATGARYDDSLMSDTTYLIAADPNGSSNKLQTARKRGTQVLDEAGLMKVLAG